MIPKDQRDRFELLNDLAVKTWGKNPQLNMVIEECGELIVAISHKKRRRAVWSKILEEYVDVLIMLKQLEFIMLDNLTMNTIHKMFRAKLRSMEMKLDLARKQN